MRRCKYCGKEYPDKAIICAADGTPLDAINPSGAPSDGKATARQDPKVEQRPEVGAQAVGSAATSEWFCAVDNNRSGPISEQAVIEKIKSGGLGRKTKTWKEGLPKWVLLENTPFREFVPKTGPPPLDQVDLDGTGEKREPPPLNQVDTKSPRNEGKPPPRPQASVWETGHLQFQTPETKRYKIYENRAGTREAVKQGWSWPAFFFTGIWAFIKKMNAIGAGVVAAYLILDIIVVSAGGGDDAGTLAAHILGGLVHLAITVFFGANGNTWREKNLISRAYEFKGTVSATSDEAALSHYWETKQASPRQ